MINNIYKCVGMKELRKVMTGLEYSIIMNNVKWKRISKREKLSEDFIRKYQDRVNWKAISRHQKLSEDFIREFQDRVDWNKIKENQEMSKDFISEFYLKLL